MTTPVRPAFFEGQVLAAADLTATVEQPRAAAARHNRHLHDWGIAQGLELTEERRTDPVTGAAFRAVTVAPGLAIDGTGREIVVADPIPLTETAFQQVNGADQVPSDPAQRPLYPVFLAGRDAVPDSLDSLIADCGGAGAASRVEETAQVIFGRRGQEQRWDDRPPPALGTGPGDGTDPWRILLGFVTWDGTHFTGTSPSGTVGRRYAGVRADRVIAQSGQLTLRPDPEVTAGRTAMVLDGAGGLKVGQLTAGGTLSDPPLLSLNSRGDLSVAGTFTPLGTPAQVLVVSGTATDGIVLPLPAGVTEQQFRAGSVQVHVQLSARVSLPRSVPNGAWVPAQVDCTVDADRRLHSSVRWLDVDQSPAQMLDLQAPARFVLIATVPGSGSSSGSTP